MLHFLWTPLLVRGVTDTGRDPAILPLRAKIIFAASYNDILLVMSQFLNNHSSKVKQIKLK